MAKDFCQEIADIIEDYRYKDRKNGNLKIDINKTHVERWVEQFQDNHEIILQETLNLLENYYFSKNDVETYLTGIYSNKRIWGEDIEKAISSTVFLNCQTKGESQDRFYKKSRKIIKNLYEIDIAGPKYKPKTFLYVDDCMFTGNTVRKDIENLIKEVPEGSTIHLIFMMVHSFAEWWVGKCLEKLIKEKNINVHSWSCYTIQNSGGKNYTYQCLWPTEYESQAVSSYLKTINEEIAMNPEKKYRLFRTSDYTGGVFTSEYNRNIFEKELMEAGLRIIGFSNDQKVFIRPMGFDNRISFGFGAFFASYLNMSNNCPLAFWWGDANAPDWHPFSNWYPLLPRKANENGGGMIDW